MPLIIPNSIDNDTPADAAELQQNFGAIQAYVNTNLLNRDGSVSLTSPLLLPGDPTQDNHAVNKEYVDASGDADIAAHVTTVHNAAPVVWTPTVVGLTVGNGTTAAYHLKQGRQCTISYSFTFGSTSTLPASLVVTLPFTALTRGVNGAGYVYDVSSSIVWPIDIIVGPTQDDIVAFYPTVVGVDIGYVGIGAGDWGVGDSIVFELTYLTAA